MRTRTNNNIICEEINRNNKQQNKGRKTTEDTQDTGIIIILSSAEPGECFTQMEGRCARLRPHIIGSPVLSVTQRSTTFMLLDGTLIRMTELSRYIGSSCLL